MIRRVNGLMVTVAMIAGPFAIPRVASGQARLPSEILHDIVRARLSNIRWTPVQAESALKPVLATVRKTNLTPDEEVALALSYFFTFDGLSAKPLFEKHMHGDDALSRVSWQSLQQMSFFGAKDYALVERRTKDYRRKFKPDADDTEYTYNMVNNLSRRAATNGDHARAVALILDDVSVLPLDMPFRSFSLLGERFASFQATNRAPEAIAWLRKHRDALQAAQAADAAAGPQVLFDSLDIPHRPGVIHFTPFVDRLLQDDPRWTRPGAVRFQRGQAIKKFDRWLEAMEKGQPVPGP